MPTFEQLMLNADHRFCVRHLYNFKTIFREKELKDKMWKEAMANTVSEFELHMSDIQKVDDKTHTWLRKLNSAWWTKSHLNTRYKCDALVNNMSDYFNSYIMEAREKPIMSMIEWIRRKLMTRIQVKRMGAEKYVSSNCPRI